MLWKLTIGNKLFWGFSVMVGLTLLVIALSYGASDAAISAIDRTRDTRIAALISASRAHSNLLEMTGKIQLTLIQDSDQFDPDYEWLKQDFQRELNHLDQLSYSMEPENQHRLADLRKALKEWDMLDEQLLALHQDRMEREPAHAWFTSTGMELLNTILTNTDLLIEYQADQPLSQRDEMLNKSLQRFRQSFLGMVSGIQDYVNKRDLNGRYYEYQTNLAMNDDAWSDILRHRSDLLPEQQIRIDAIGVARQNFIDQLNGEVFVVVESDHWRKDLYLFDTSIIPLANNMKTLLEDMVTSQQYALDRDLHYSRYGLDMARWQTAGWGVVAILLGIVLGIFFRQTVVGPIYRLTDVAHQIEKGNLSIEARVESEDEIGTFARTFNNMTARLQQTFSQLVHAQEEVRIINAELEQRVEERTAELDQTIVALHRKIKEQERMNDLLQYHAHLVESVSEAIISTDISFAIQSWNTAAEAIYGWKAEEVKDMKEMEILKTEFTTSNKQELLELFFAQGFWEGEVAQRRKDGSVVYIFSSLSLLRDRVGKPLGTVAVNHDITRRKQAEEAIKAAYAELRRKSQILYTLIDGINDGLLLLDDMGVVLASNHAVGLLLGCTPNKLVGQRWDDICRHVSPVFPGEEALLTLKNKKDRNYRVVYTDSRNREYILDIKTIPLMESVQRETIDEESPYSMIVHITDMTERFLWQARMIENERFAASGRVAATVAHEVNTPLQAMQGLFHLIRTARKKQERDRYLYQATEEVERIGNILHQLLEFSHPGTGVPTPVDVNRVIERVLLLTSGAMAKQRIVVNRNLDGTLPFFIGQSDEIKQVLLNIMLNAVDAMPLGGELRVATWSGTWEHVRHWWETNHHQPENNDAENHALVASLPVLPHTDTLIVIEISDNGMGIPPDKQEKIFDPFYTTKAHGTGLGLSISQKIISRYGGKIIVASEPGTGTTFTVVMPQGS